MKRPLEPVHGPEQLKEHLDVHKALWQLQRVFVAIVVLVMLLSFAGLFGEGWLSHVQESQEGASLQYERFSRNGKESMLEVTTSANDIVIPAEYFKEFQLRRVVPQPAAQEMRGGDIIFRFSGSTGVRARFHVLPMGIGTVNATVSTGNASFSVNQFTYP